MKVYFISQGGSDFSGVWLRSKRIVALPSAPQTATGELNHLGAKKVEHRLCGLVAPNLEDSGRHTVGALVLLMKEQPFFERNIFALLESCELAEFLVAKLQRMLALQ